MAGDSGKAFIVFYVASHGKEFLCKNFSAMHAERTTVVNEELLIK